MSDAVIKTLYAYSSNVCAFIDIHGGRGCEEALTDPAWPGVKGRICHIRARQPGGPRYDAGMTPEQRDAFENLILLCPTHHVQIDNCEPDTYSVEVLLDMKDRGLRRAESARTFLTDVELERVTQITRRTMRAEWAIEDLLMSSSSNLTGTSGSVSGSSSTLTVEPRSAREEIRTDDSVTPEIDLSRATTEEVRTEDTAT